MPAKTMLALCEMRDLCIKMQNDEDSACELRNLQGRGKSYPLWIEVVENLLMMLIT